MPRTSVFLPLNIVYGLTIVSLLLIKFYYDYAPKLGKASAKIGSEERAFLTDYSFIAAFKDNLETAHGNDDGLREKELLQFLCAMTIMKIEFGKFLQKALKFENDDIRETKRSGSSMYASASNVIDDDADWRRYVDKSTTPEEQQRRNIAEISRYMGITNTLLDEFVPAKIIYFLRKFGIAFGSVEEMLQKEGDNWFLAKECLDAVNVLLGITIESSVQWKWVHKGKTGFPLISADECKPYWRP